MKIKRGSTSVRRLIFIADSSSTTGAGLTGVAYNTSGLVAYYFAGDLSNEVQITLASATLGTFTSGGFVEVDATNMPGWYEVGIPNAALDGGNEVAIQYRGAADMVPVNIYIELDTVDYQTDAFGAALASNYTGTRAGYLDKLNVSGTLAHSDDASTYKATGFSTHSAADVVTAMGTGTFLTAIPWNAAWDAEVQSECSDAITSYDPPTYTELLNLVRLIVRKDSGVASDLSSVISDINADLGSGGGNYTLQNDSLEALRDRGDAAWITATGFSTLDAAGIRTAVGLSSANLDTQLGAIVADTNELQVNQGNWLTADISGLATAAALATVDTVVDGIKAVTDKVDTSLESDGASGYQFTTLALENAPAGGGGGDATEANQTTIINHLTAIKGAGFDTSTDSLQAIRDRGDAAWTSSSGGSGARTVTITVVDDAAVAVNRAQVNVFSSAGDPIGIYGDTNSSGIVTFNLNDGNYKLAVTDMAGYESHTAEAFTVSSGSTTATIELTLTPTSGASYALKVSYSELRREVGRHLGFNRDPSSWEANEIQDVADIIKSGQWHFYWPPAIDQATPFQTHQWSFLCVSYQISLVAGTVAYELPDDFVRMQSGFTFGNDGNQFRISVIDDETLRSMQSKSYLTGTPHYVAIRARNNRLDEGYELAFYPTPDMAYTIDFRYEKLPNEITSVNPYHLGPAVHSKLLLSACLMEADRKLNPETMSPDGGLHAQQFFRQLRASIAVDRQAIGMSS